MIMQIEHKDAIANLDAILSVEGVDGVFIGPLDLSGSMGITGQLDHPQMAAALKKYRAACRARKKSAGMHIIRPTTQTSAARWTRAIRCSRSAWTTCSWSKARAPP